MLHTPILRIIKKKIQKRFKKIKLFLKSKMNTGTVLINIFP
jgi:hypothetical protein